MAKLYHEQIIGTRSALHAIVKAFPEARLRWDKMMAWAMEKHVHYEIWVMERAIRKREREEYPDERCERLLYR